MIVCTESVYAVVESVIMFCQARLVGEVVQVDQVM